MSAEQHPITINRRTLLKTAAATGAAALLAEQLGQVLASPAAAQGERLPKEQQIYYFLALNISDPFYVPGRAGMEAAAKMLGVRAELVGPSDFNVAAQVKAGEEILAKPGTAGIFAYAVEFGALKPVIEQAKENGIPVVHGAADWGQPRDAFIGYDMDKFGSEAADVAGRLLGGKGKVGFMGNAGQNVIDRGKAFEKYIKERYPEIEWAGSQVHDASLAGATRTFEAFLGATPDLDLLWFGDGLSGSLANVVKERGGKLKFLATDMPPHTLKAIKDGIFVASMGQDTFTEEFFGFQLLYFAYNGQRIPDTVLLKAIVVTPENVDQFLQG